MSLASWHGLTICITINYSIDTLKLPTVQKQYKETGLSGIAPISYPSLEQAGTHNFRNRNENSYSNENVLEFH